MRIGIHTRDPSRRLRLFLGMNPVFDVVDEVLGLLLDFVDGVFHLAARAVGLPLVFQVGVVCEIADRLFRTSLEVIGVRFHGFAPLRGSSPLGQSWSKTWSTCAARRESDQSERRVV